MMALKQACSEPGEQQPPGQANAHTAEGNGKNAQGNGRNDQANGSSTPNGDAVFDDDQNEGVHTKQESLAVSYEVAAKVGHCVSCVYACGACVLLVCFVLPFVHVRSGLTVLYEVAAKVCF